MNLDINKTNPSPNDQWHAIDLMVKAQQSLLDSLFILGSVLENNTPDFKEIHEKRIKEFIKQFEL